MILFDELLKFYNSKTSKSNSIFSFAYPIKKINFSSLLNSLQSTRRKMFYWSHSDMEFLGVGDLFSICNYKNSNFETTISQLSRKHFNNFTNYKLSQVPLIIGAEKFQDNKNSTLWNDFEKKEWFIAKYIFLRNKNKKYLIINICSKQKNLINIKKSVDVLFEYNDRNVKHEENTNILIKEKNAKKTKFEFEDWKNKIESILQRIKQNQIQKVVLSRQLKYKLKYAFQINILMKKLINKYPDCYCFTFKKNKSFFLGASPEKLAKIQNGYIETVALAGSINRGKNLSEDKTLEKILLSDKKNISEQKAVVKFIMSRLKIISKEIKYKNKPIIKKLAHIQHLFTKIKAKINNGITVTKIINTLHPTPAICGVPLEKAVSIISELENHERGLYSGVIGWFNLDNEGELAVAIRSGLLKNKKLYVFAGCGVVNGSDAKEEFNESELKLKTIKSLFKI